MNSIKAILLVILVSLPLNLLSNEISWPFLHASDYYRGTAGERLMFINHDKKVGTIYIYNDLRHYNFKNYFGIHHDKREVDGYKRTINIFSLNYIPLRNLILSVRVPYVNANNKWNFQYSYTNSGISDVFIGAAYRFWHRNGKEVYFSTGLKLPTGRNYHNTRKIPISTGSYDVPFMINTNFSFHNMVNYLDFGLILNGDSDEYPFDSDRKENNGKELFFDYAIAKKISRFSLISEINYVSPQ